MDGVAIRQSPELFRRQLNARLAAVDTRLVLDLSGNGSFVVPAGWALRDLYFVNATAHAVTGGIRVGTTAGAADVVAAQAVGANALGHVPDAAILERLFDATAPQTLHVQAVTSWNGATVRLRPILTKVI